MVSFRKTDNSIRYSSRNISKSMISEVSDCTVNNKTYKPGFTDQNRLSINSNINEKLLPRITEHRESENLNI